MASNGQANDWPRLGLMIATALVLHVALLLVVLPARQDAERWSIELQWVELARPAASETMLEDAPPAAAERRPEPTPEPEALGSSEATAATAAPPSEPDSMAEPTPAAPSAERLRELALIAARAQAESSAPPRAALEGFAVPRLPGEAGWLNDHVGTVSPRAERWQEADGAGASRVVTASGQVYCGRARAPTAAEEFNPWMSAVVMTWRPCGRERPEPVDRSNPWVRGSGTAQD